MNRSNARQMLMDLGSKPSLATMALPYVWFLAGTTDPDAQGVIEIVNAVQRGLQKLGYKVMVSGVLDRPTAEALDRLMPPKGVWVNSTWIVIMQAILRAIRGPRLDPRPRGRRAPLGPGRGRHPARVDQKSRSARQAELARGFAYFAACRAELYSRARDHGHQRARPGQAGIPA